MMNKEYEAFRISRMRRLWSHDEDMGLTMITATTSSLQHIIPQNVYNAWPLFPLPAWSNVALVPGSIPSYRRLSRLRASLANACMSSQAHDFEIFHILH